MQNKTKPVDNQDAFNRVWRHFIIEKHPRCVGNTGQCQYRKGNNGCAVGCMLPKILANKADSYSVAIGIDCILVKFPEIEEWFSNIDKNLLRSLQWAHDNLFRDLKLHFERIARRYKLKIPKI